MTRTANARAANKGKAPTEVTHWIDYLPPDELQSAARNPKGHDAVGIARAIDHHGLVEVPTLDERTGRLVAGHGRRDDVIARRAAGQSPPRGVQVRDDGVWLMPVLRGWSSRSDDDADAYVIGSNLLAEMGGWDNHELAEVLTGLADAQMLEIAGSGDDHMRQVLADLAAERADPEPDDEPRPRNADAETGHDVLIVCDSPLAQATTIHALELQGYEVRPVTSKVTARRKAR